MCLFEKIIIILTSLVCCLATVFTIAVLIEVRLGQGTEKPEAGHQANEARVILVFTKKGHRLANRNIIYF
jgi:hypothetical protein